MNVTTSSSGRPCKYLSEFGLTQEDIKLSRQHKIQSISATVSHYDQIFQGVKVFGGRLTVFSGRHGEVIRATGEALLDISVLKHFEAIPSWSSSAALQSVNNYIMTKFGKKAKDTVDAKSELVFHRKNLGSDVIPSKPILAHHIEGRFLISFENVEQEIDCNAFIDATTGELISFKDEARKEYYIERLKSFSFDKKYHMN